MACLNVLTILTYSRYCLSNFVYNISQLDKHNFALQFSKRNFVVIMCPYFLFYVGEDTVELWIIGLYGKSSNVTRMFIGTVGSMYCLKLLLIGSIMLCRFATWIDSSEHNNFFLNFDLPIHQILDRLWELIRIIDRTSFFPTKNLYFL